MLFGFAVVVQTVGTLVAAAGVAAVGIFSFSRLATLSPGTDDFEAVLAGSIALTAVTGVVLTLAAAALSVLVQGIVVGEVAHAAVAEKQTLGMLWRRVKPVAGRLIAYTALVSLTVLVVLAIIAAGLVALTVTCPADRNRGHRADGGRGDSPQSVALHETLAGSIRDRARARDRDRCDPGAPGS